MPEPLKTVPTPRECVRMTLEHRQPQRIPWHMEFTKEAHRKMADFLGDPDFEGKLGCHLITTKVLAPGYPRDRGPGLFEDEFGVVWDRRFDQSLGMPRPVLDGPDLAGYRFPDPDDLGRYAHLGPWIAGNASLFRVVKISHTLFERAWSMRGYQEFMADMLLHPAFVEELFTRITEFNLAILDRLKDHDIDAIWFGDDWGGQDGLLMSPPLWRQMIKPHLKRMYARVRELGFTVMIHCCGAIEELLPELIDLGVQVFNPFQPEVMETGRLKRLYGEQLTFFGGLSIQRVLPFGTPEQVRLETRRLISEIGRDGGYILSPAHALPGDIPPENIQAMILEAKS